MKFNEGITHRRFIKLITCLFFFFLHWYSCLSSARGGVGVHSPGSHMVRAHFTPFDLGPNAWAMRGSDMKHGDIRGIYVYVLGSQLHIHKPSWREGRLHAASENLVPMEMARERSLCRGLWHHVRRLDGVGTEWAGRRTEKSHVKNGACVTLWSVVFGLTSRRFLYNPPNTPLKGCHTLSQRLCLQLIFCWSQRLVLVASDKCSFLE